MMCYFLDENDEKMKNIVKVAVVEAIEQALTPAVQDFHECVNEALKSHMSHQAFIKKAVEGALFNEILGFLQCVICRETSNPPIIVATCCESIIGCQQCAKTWIDSGKNTCPKCREEGFNCATINLRGLDDFLGKIHI